MKIIALILLFGIKGFGQNDTVSKILPANIWKAPSIKKEDEPLYIVDGAFIKYADFLKIDPETIEFMTILKDSSVLNFCHVSRKKVIVISTKKLRKRENRKMKKKFV